METGFINLTFLRDTGFERDAYSKGSVADFRLWNTLLLPMGDNSHYTLFIVDNVNRKIRHLDSLSLGKSDNQRKVAQGLMELSNKIMDTDCYRIDWSDTFNFRKQKDGFNCGPFVCLYMYCICMNVSTPSNLDMSVLRSRIIIDIDRGFISTNPVKSPQFFECFLDILPSSTDVTDEVLVIEAPGNSNMPTTVPATMGSVEVEVGNRAANMKPPFQHSEEILAAPGHIQICPVKNEQITTSVLSNNGSMVTMGKGSPKRSRLAQSLVSKSASGNGNESEDSLYPPLGSSFYNKPPSSLPKGLVK
jgi:hypothetical protein